MKVGDNTFGQTFDIDRSGETSVTISGTLTSPLSFTVREGAQDVKVSAGTLEGNVWTLDVSDTLPAVLTVKLPAAGSVWRPSGVTESFAPQKVEETLNSQVQLPPGYKALDIPPPVDPFGRPQLFEPLGMAITKDGSAIVSTRSAGVWLLRAGNWTQMAEGLLDAMAVVIEKDDLSQIVVGQKPEVTRLIDHDKDGRFDEYVTLSDDFLHSTDYHEYLHGPTKGADGNYYFTLNLSNAKEEISYRAGGKFMGTAGGYRAWAMKVTPDGVTTPFANGLRSPAGISTGPDGRLYYTDNQGEFNGTSKLYVLEEGKFYSHPSGLIDLPGMTPESPEIQWDAVKETREQPLAMLAHSIVSNSPGHPVWDTTEGAFGPFSGDIFLGDQTLSTLFRIRPHEVDGVEESALIPFGKNFPSGVMRMNFLPNGNLLVGQTGRGWRAAGGKEAALVMVSRTQEPLGNYLLDVQREGDVFRLTFSEDLDPSLDTKTLEVKSWTYTDSPNYGSNEVEKRNETIANVAQPDSKTLEISITSPEPIGQLPRLYQFTSKDLPATTPSGLEAYYTRLK